MTAFLPTSGQQKHAKTIAQRRVLNFCVMDDKPFSTSDGPGFHSFGQAMLDIGAKIGGKVKIEDNLPGRRTISNDAQKKFREKKIEMGKILQMHIASGYMIGTTTDLCSDDIKHQHYMSITVHYVHNWRLVSRLAMLKNLPASSKKTSLNLRSELILAFQELAIKADLVKTHVMFTTDCGANIVKALSEVGCACHQLAMVLRYVFATTKEKQTFIDILLQTEEDYVEGIFQRQPDIDGVENQLETVSQVNKQLEAMSKIVTYLKRSG